MGILNVTPDSFSDGTAHLVTDVLVERGLRLASEGADIVDVGGESTRPGATRVDVEEELRRVIPVVRRLADAGVVVSVDTMRARVASAAIEAGAFLVNDVSGGLADPSMAHVVADANVAYVAMHWRGHSAQMHRHATYQDVVADVVGELAVRLESLVGAGVSEHRIILDPGIGFAKTAEHNWAILGALDELQRLGRPILIGASRKAFLGKLMGEAVGTEPPARQRDSLTCAVSTLVASAGAYCVRVHDVRSTREAIAVADAWADHGAKIRTYSHNSPAR
ncbi:dihydropteroate synthase [Nocardia sp. NPDC004860]|uniref:dihydropteroate synthase n=1 Tax=Nocardia sp. NPDC004860 TaxID=3154557 RepID=UPI0033AFF023